MSYDICTGALMMTTRNILR